MTNENNGTARVLDCIVVGGGAAGLSAALVLGRARRDTLVIDAGAPSNLPAHGIGGLLGHDGRRPAELYAMGRAELERYPTVEVRDGEVADGSITQDGIVLTMADGSVATARRVVLATGTRYRYRDLPGADQLWGGAVFHCPFCHGWEMRDRPLAVLSNGAMATHGALLLRNWTRDVVLLTDGPADLEPADRQRLADAGVTVDERPVARLIGTDEELVAIEFADGGQLPRQGLMVRVAQDQRSDLAARLGVTPGEATPMATAPVAVNPSYETNVPGVYAVGDLTGAMPQVAGAIAAGSQAGAMVVQGLVAQGLVARDQVARDLAADQSGR